MATTIDGTAGAIDAWLPTVPNDYINSLTDCGRWRELVTHWHLMRTEAPITVGGRMNDARFDTETIRTAVAMAKETTTDPHEALRWVYTHTIEGLLSGADPARYTAQRGWRSQVDLEFSIDVAWEFMTEKVSLLTPIGGGIEVRRNLSLDVFAYPQTVEMCRRPHGRL